MKRTTALIFDKLKHSVKIKKPSQIKADLLIVVSAFFLIIFIFFFAFIYLNVLNLERFSEEQQFIRINSQLRQWSQIINRELESTDKIATAIYKQESYRFYNNVLSNNSQLEEFKFRSTIDYIFKSNTDISGITIYTENGSLLSYSNADSPYYFKSISGTFCKSVVDKYKDRGIDYVLEMEKSEYPKGILFAKTFRNEETKRIQSVIIAKNLGLLNSYFRNIDFPESDTIFLLNSNNEVLFSTGSKSDNTLIDNKQVKLLNESQGKVKFTDNSGNTQYIIYDKSVFFGCNLLLLVPETYLNANKLSALRFMLFSSLILICVIVISIFFFKRKVYYPIKSIENVFNSLVQGDLNFELGKLSNSGAFSHIYQNLNMMSDKLKDLIKSEYTSKVLMKQAELNALQSQINPHFLYNTLESIRGMAISEGVNNIEHMTKSLADLFRYSISRKNNMVKLEEELKNIENYLVIMQYRFNNKFIVVNKVDEDTLECKVPKLLIQPLVENSIRHGLELKLGKGTIKLIAYKTQDKLILNINDDGDGIRPEELKIINEGLLNGNDSLDLESKGSRIGLVNVNVRIKLLYGSEYGIRIYSTLGIGTSIEVFLPLIM